jgi:hypothetical protein
VTRPSDERLCAVLLMLAGKPPVPPTKLPRGVIDLARKQFGHLSVISYVGQSRHHAARWACLCRCGALTTVLSRNLRSGNSSQCFACGQGERGEKRRRQTLDCLE